jgi:hypothetical protein
MDVETRGGGQGGAAPPPPVFGISINPIPTKGGRLWPPHYYSPLPDFQTFLRPCRIVQESVVVETKNLLHHFSVFLADHWSTWVAPVPFSKDWRKRQLVLKSCHLLFILLGANLCLVKLEASLEVSFSKLLFTPHSQKKVLIRSWTVISSWEAAEIRMYNPLSTFCPCSL